MKTYTQKIELLEKQIIFSIEKKINAKGTDIEFGQFGIKLPTDVFNEVVINGVLIAYIIKVGLNINLMCENGYYFSLTNLPLNELAIIADLL